MNRRQTTSDRLTELLNELKSITVAPDIDPSLLEEVAREARRLAAGKPSPTGERRAVQIHADYTVDRTVETYTYTCEDCQKSVTAEGMPGTFRRKVCDDCALTRRRKRQQEYVNRKRGKTTVEATEVDSNEQGTIVPNAAVSQNSDEAPAQPVKPSKALKAWNALNPRQQIYLRAVYEIDQEKESYWKSEGASGNYNIPPASEWRWMNYHPRGLEDSSRLQDEIGREHIDPGTGSTFEALEARGLILCSHRGTERLPMLWVQITKAGRAAVRAGLPDDEKPQRKAKGQLAHSSWKALKLAYEAGEEGIRRTLYDVNYARISWDTWVRLRNREPALITEREEGFRDYALVITDAGRRFYEERLELHRAAYPDLYSD